MVKERYTGFQLHRVNDSGGLNTDDIDYGLTNRRVLEDFVSVLKFQMVFLHSNQSVNHAVTWQTTWNNNTGNTAATI
jgi:hypothetical protein